jgi:hypothetical protein
LNRAATRQKRALLTVIAPSIVLILIFLTLISFQLLK